MSEFLSQDDIDQLIGRYDYGAYMTEEPYQVLADIEDELTRARIRGAMREKAKRFGVSAGMFDAMAKAALKDRKAAEAERKKQEKKDKRQNAMDDLMSDGGPLEGLAEMLGDTPNFGKYICTNRAISYLNGWGDPVKVCNHPIFPTGRSVNIEDGSEMLDISYRIDGKWKTRQGIDRTILSQSRTVTQLSRFGLDVTSENAREVVNYIAEVDQLNRDLIPRRETVNRLGWIDGRGFSPYIEGVQYHAAEGERFDEAFRAVRTEGDFGIWKETAGKIMADKQWLPARLALAASVASVLLKWTGSQPFIVHLWSAESGTGKTVALMLAASVWADPDVGRYIKSMNATKVANEQMASFCNNLPLILDELQTIQKRSDFDDVIYMLCEGTGKARGAKDGGLRKQTKWLNTIITSGEQPISADSRAGAVNRVISIEADGAVVPGNKVDMGEMADTLRENFGHAGRMIVDRILSVKDFKDIIRRNYQTAVLRLADKVTGKQANYGATLLVGDALLNSIVFGGQYDTVVPEDILPYLATQEMVDTNAKARDWLVSFVASNAARFRKPEDGAATEIRGDLLGRICANGDVMIIKGALKEQLDRRGWTMSAFLKWCHQKQLLHTNHTEKNRHWEVWTNIQGLETSVPVIHFAAEMFRNDRAEPEPVDMEVPFG